MPPLKWVRIPRNDPALASPVRPRLAPGAPHTRRTRVLLILSCVYSRGGATAAKKAEGVRNRSLTED
jgi:hypothetical protein